MSDTFDRDDLTIVTATALEAKAARRALPGFRVVEGGISLAQLRAVGGLGSATTIVSCGLAGGLHARHPSGTVLVPRVVRRPDGTTLRCDAEMTDALAEAARRLGYEPVHDPLLTSVTIVRGPERGAWAASGFSGVDMETGLLEAPRIAAVRVILDTPARELNADWLRPVRALSDPRNWPEAIWLAREAPRYARRAAEVVAAAC
jgi:hypothetical protein